MSRHAQGSARVAYLVNSYPSPTQTFIRREIASLESLGLEVSRFAVRRWSGPLPDADDASEQRKTIYLLERSAWALIAAVLVRLCTSPVTSISALHLAWRLGRKSPRGVLVHLAYFVEACILQRLLSTSGIAHVHAHFGTNSTAVAMLCKTLGGPTYSCTVHGPEEFDDPLGLGLPEKIERAAFVVGISQFARSQLLRWTPLAQWHKVHVIHCGLDDSFFVEQPSKQSQRSDLICIGRLAEQKGQALLLDALVELGQQGVRPRLTVVGDGPMRSELEARIAHLGLKDQVELTGWLSNSATVERLKSARALIVSSFAEGLPVVIMEAMAVGTPVVATRIAGIPELVLNGECGWIVTPGDRGELAKAIAHVLSASELELESVRRTAFVKVRSQHSARNEAEGLQRLFVEYVDRHSR